MRYSKEHKLETHARIVKKASVRLREKGAHGIGVADLMKDAGLTHGGFYAHFDSREALVSRPFAAAMDRATERWGKIDAQGLLGKTRADDRHHGRSDPGCSAQGGAQAGDGHARDHDGDAGAVPHRR